MRIGLIAAAVLGRLDPRGLRLLGLVLACSGLRPGARAGAAGARRPLRERRRGDRRRGGGLRRRDRRSRGPSDRRQQLGLLVQSVPRGVPLLPEAGRRAPRRGRVPRSGLRGRGRGGRHLPRVEPASLPEHRGPREGGVREVGRHHARRACRTRSSTTARASSSTPTRARTRARTTSRPTSPSTPSAPSAFGRFFARLNFAEAGVASTLPAASIARTLSVCLPRFSPFSFSGEVQAE